MYGIGTPPLSPPSALGSGRGRVDRGKCLEAAMRWYAPALLNTINTSEPLSRTRNCYYGGVRRSRGWGSQPRDDARLVPQSRDDARSRVSGPVRFVVCGPSRLVGLVVAGPQIVRRSVAPLGRPFRCWMGKPHTRLGGWGLRGALCP